MDTRIGAFPARALPDLLKPIAHSDSTLAGCMREPPICASGGLPAVISYACRSG
jgi:hypothetical protein